MTGFSRRTLALSPLLCSPFSVLMSQQAHAYSPAFSAPPSLLRSQSSVLSEAAALVEFGDLPASLLIAMADQGGKVTFATKGEHPDGSTATPMDHYRVGSQTKIFTSTLVLTLLDEAKLDLDDPAATYITRAPIPADITIRQLLSHTSGIPNYMDVGALYDANQADPDRIWTPEDLIALIVDEPHTEPGSEFIYTNTNFVYLGILIEEITGQTYSEVLTERILTPLKLEETWLDDGTASGPAPVTAWTSTETGFGPFDGPYTALATCTWTAGAMISTPADIHTFLSALPTGDLISAEAFTAMTAAPAWEYGLGLIPMAENGAAYGHQGNMPGYSTFAAHGKDTGKTIFIAITNDAIDYSPALNNLLPLLIEET